MKMQGELNNQHANCSSMQIVHANRQLSLKQVNSGVNTGKRITRPKLDLLYGGLFFIAEQASRTAYLCKLLTSLASSSSTANLSMMKGYGKFAKECTTNRLLNKWRRHKVRPHGSESPVVKAGPHSWPRPGWTIISTRKGYCSNTWERQGNSVI